MTHPNTDQGVTAEDREWADKVIAVEHPNNHEAYEYAVAEVIVAHRLSSTAALEAEVERVRQANIDCVLHFDNLKSDYDQARAEIASLKQRLESAEGEFKQIQVAAGMMRVFGLGTTQDEWAAEIINRSKAFLQEQEKQNG